MGPRTFARLKSLMLATTALVIFAAASFFMLLSPVAGRQETKYPLPALDLEVYANYPGAQKVKRDTPTEMTLLSVDFPTSDIPQQVEAYYKDLAIRTGWQYVGQWTSIGDGHIPHYTYGGYGQNYAYGYDMSFGTYWASPGTHGWIRIDKSLPIYFGANDIVTHEYIRPDVSFRTTDFATKGSPETVLAFYRSVMQGDGWTPLAQKDADSAEFYLDNSSDEGPFGRYRLQATAKADDSGITQVEVSEGFGMVQGP